jgi:hypothetical protein
MYLFNIHRIYHSPSDVDKTKLCFHTVLKPVLMVMKYLARFYSKPSLMGAVASRSCKHPAIEDNGLDFEYAEREI